jgi:hypothetical protein
MSPPESALRPGPRSAAEALDVSRIEHENLSRLVEEHSRSIRRLEEEVRRLREELGVATPRSGT